MSSLITTLGPRSLDDQEIILPHEHIFVDLGPIEDENWRNARTSDVIEVMTPHLKAIRAQGVTTFVESTPMGVGRRADIDLAVSQAVDLPVIVPTGIYREPWIPDWAHKMDGVELGSWMEKELCEGIEESGVQAGWIKISAGDEEISPAEMRLVEAAAYAGERTGAVIGSHTIRGSVVKEQVSRLEQYGYRADRFIWIHTQAEPDFDLHIEMGRRGVWLEYDGIGGPQSDESYVERIQRLLDADLGHRLLLSHDRGWYDPSKPGGGEQKPFTYLVDQFLPKLEAAGIDQKTIRSLVRDNPFHAYAR